MADTPPLSFPLPYAPSSSRTKRTVRFPCPFSNCCRSLSPLPPSSPFASGMDATSVCGEAADCTASLSPFLRICWRASVRARVDGGTVFPPWRTRSLAYSPARRPAAARARSLGSPMAACSPPPSCRSIPSSRWGRFLTTCRCELMGKIRFQRCLPTLRCKWRQI